MFNKYYVLDDGRIWSIESATFVPVEEPSYVAWVMADNAPFCAPDKQGQCTDMALKEALIFYGLPTGELCKTPPTLEQSRNAKLAEINAGYSAVMAYIQAGYPPEEILSWERQSTQAQALQQNPEAAAAFVRGLAATKGVEVEEMAQRILANAASWEPVAAMLTGQRQLLEEMAYCAETVESINAIKAGYTV